MMLCGALDVSLSWVAEDICFQGEEPILYYLHAVPVLLEEGGESRCQEKSCQPEAHSFRESARGLLLSASANASCAQPSQRPPFVKGLESHCLAVDSAILRMNLLRRKGKIESHLMDMPRRQGKIWLTQEAGVL